MGRETRDRLDDMAAAAAVTLDKLLDAAAAAREYAELDQQGRGVVDATMDAITAAGRALAAIERSRQAAIMAG